MSLYFLMTGLMLAGFNLGYIFGEKKGVEKKILTLNMRSEDLPEELKLLRAVHFRGEGVLLQQSKGAAKGFLEAVNDYREFHGEKAIQAQKKKIFK